MYNSFKPGKVWLDTDGKRIQAHGGGILYIDNTFYWYGENKEKSISEFEIWHWGVKLYSSKDLYNWKDEGLILPPEPDCSASPMHPLSKMDRPHIIYNESTGKYVMWIKVMGNVGRDQYMVTAQADTIFGPFELVNRVLHPGGMNSGDFDLVKFDDGRAAIVFERVHSDMIVLELTNDYLDTTLKFSEHYKRKCPPYVREAPCFFSRGGRNYVITSGTTGKFPNPSEVAEYDDIHGKWKVLGETHIGDVKKTSFDSQVSCVFKHPRKKDLYIAAADRWLTDLDDSSPNGVEYFAAMFDPDCEMDEEKREKLKNTKLSDITKKNTANADYVWLPIKFENDIPHIYWKDEWRIEDYEDA